MQIKNLDYLQVSLVANLIAIVVVIGTAIILAWNNAGSKNMPLGAAALIGVTVGYAIQLPFELARSTARDVIGVDLTIDRSSPVIRQWVYSNGPHAGWRIAVEVGASNWLAQGQPIMFDELGKRDRIASDLVMFSLLSFLTHEEYDWQLQTSSYGALQLHQPMSKPEECRSYSEADLRQRLQNSGNIFGGAPLQVLTGKLCLPPKTSPKCLETR